jgi:hypothetical protein
MLDRFACYELCVQSPRHITAFLRALHGQHPTVLREDFAGTAAISRQWCLEAARAGESARAIAVELDPETSRRAAELMAESNLGASLKLIQGNCLAPPCNGQQPDAADVVFVGNFSIGYIHDRPSLIQYLAHSLNRLRRGNAGFGGGVFACDTYGGAGAFRLGGIERKHPGRRGEVIRYSWLHEHADPRTSTVRNSISFRVEINGEIAQEWPRAFVYEWRLWSIAELREAMAEVGFSDINVFKDVNIAPGETPRPVDNPAELGDDWIVIVAGRA